MKYNFIIDDFESENDKYLNFGEKCEVGGEGGMKSANEGHATKNLGKYKMLLEKNK